MTYPFTELVTTDSNPSFWFCAFSWPSISVLGATDSPCSQSLVQGDLRYVANVVIQE